jgi:hypothetical protein
MRRNPRGIAAKPFAPKAEEHKERTADRRRFTQITMILRLHSLTVRAGLFFSKDRKTPPTLERHLTTKSVIEAQNQICVNLRPSAVRFFLRSFAAIPFSPGYAGV